MIRLFTSFYEETRKQRRDEFLYCLRRNLDCERIEEICVISQGVVDLPESDRLFVREVATRPDYDDFFAWVNEVAAPDDVSIIANADIWFDGSIAVSNRSLGKSECYALARWEDDGLFNRNDSQDSWIFRGSIIGVTGNFPPGVPRCDNRLLYELQSAGYRVTNPAFGIVTHHEHSGRRAEYDDWNLENFVAPPYRYLWPHNLWSLPRTAIHNFRRPGEHLEWRVDRRRLRATLPYRVLNKVGSLSARRD
jgi:hypothetical protein